MMALSDCLYFPPASESHTSNSSGVGHGTWDPHRDAYLLHNLMGHRFDTMRYNGELRESYTFLFIDHFVF